MKNLFSNQFLLVLALIILTSLSRLIPHQMNFEPVIAISLFAGAYISSKKWVFVLPLLSLLISDIIIYSSNGYEFFTFLTLSVYTSFALITLMGFKLKNNLSVSKLMMVSIAACIVFFVLTNSTAWAEGSCGLYANNFTGLLDAYTAAVYPYFTDSIISTLLYSGILFGAVEFAKYKSPALAENR